MSSKVIAARLQELEDQFGRITPQIVVDDARNPSSPLHSQFQWDNKIAADRYRLMQARKLIRTIVVKVISETRIIRSVAYVRDPACEAGEQGYVSITTLRKDPDQAHEALTNEFSRAAAALRRAHSIAHALGKADEVGELMERVEKLQRDVEATSPQLSS